MPTFKPDPNVKRALITLLNLWAQRVETNTNEEIIKSKLLKPTMKMKTFLGLVNKGDISISPDVLTKYIENVPAIANLVADKNRDTITINTGEEQPETAEQPEEPEVAAPETAEVPATEMPAEQPTSETPAPEIPAAPEAEEPERASRRNIVAQMAQRSARRATK